MTRRSLLRPLWASLAALGASACLSPTLPLPPPEEPSTVELQSDGETWAVRGRCTRGAQVVVLNEATGRGVVFEDREQSGAYAVLLPASVCDLASVTIVVDGEASGSTSFVVQERRDGVDVDASTCSP
jgi:hypothetical protein